LQGKKAGRGARSNGHEGDYHDGLRSLYDFRTLFHGASTHSKEDQREVGAENPFEETKHLPLRRTCPRQHSALPLKISFSPFHFLQPPRPAQRGAILLFDNRR
jgi:hypothetical protein